jgi:NAD(P)H-flavin reductase
MTLHIKSSGSWTAKLNNLAKDNEVDSDKPMIAFVEGPYGIPSIDFESECYRIVVLISGGIGVTPNQAICNDLIDAHSKGRKMLKIIFIWIVRDLAIAHAMIDSDHFPTIKAQSMSTITSVDQQSDHTILNPMTSKYQSVMDLPTEVTATTHHDDSLYKPLLLHAEIYHTSKTGMSGGELEKHSLSDDAVIIQGRPDFSKIFSRINEFAASRGESKIGVSICGPDAMVIDATKACRELKQDTVKWDTHFEVFNL